SPTTYALKNSAGDIHQLQSFNETRAMRVTPSSNVIVTALILEGLAPSGPGTVGGRIYDASTQALVASGDTNIGSIPGPKIEVAVAATLMAGKSYMVGFFVDAGGTSSADLYEPSVLPFTAGPFTVTAFGDVGPDAYPSVTNLAAPQMSI